MTQGEITMNNKEFINYANSFQSVAKLRLESIGELMNELFNPQDELKFIHVAGTNGKGSVCCFLQNILSDAGYKTGKYTSPNMIKVNERISVDGIEITDDELNKLLTNVLENAERVKEKLGELPTQFEIWTAAAFCYFKEKKCDYVILETGLGGERDATNIIKNPIITAITRIALDHTEYLGESISDIANAKAGIIKNSIYGGCTVTTHQDDIVLNILKNSAISHNNDFIVTKTPYIHKFNGQFEVFDYNNMNDIKMSMLGTHQAENAAIAIECARKLGIDEKDIRSGIKKAKNPGRLEILSDNPFILFDGAHNKNGMKSLSDNLIRCFPGRKKCFIMGFMHDKDIDSAIMTLKENNLDFDTNFYTVEVKDNTRAISANDLSEKLKNHGFNSMPCRDLKEALNLANVENAMIILCGSLYLYKDLSEIL